MSQPISRRTPVTDLIPAPVKGMKFVHAKRKTWMGDPVVGIVTSVSEHKGLVYWSDGLHANRMKTPLTVWDKMCAEVLSVPDPRREGNGPRLTKGESSALHHQANLAGMRAGAAHEPTSLVGSAMVLVAKDNGSYARWLRDTGHGSNIDGGGTALHVRHFGQDPVRKHAYAVAYAKVLNEAGVEAYSSGGED